MAEIVHVCRPGDSLTLIAVTYYGNVTRWREIQAYNKIQDGNKLRVGQAVRVPNPTMGKGVLPVAPTSVAQQNDPRGQPAYKDPFAAPTPPKTEAPKTPPAQPLVKQKEEPLPEDGEEFRKVILAGKFGVSVLGSTFKGMDKYIELLGIIFKLDPKDLKDSKTALGKGKEFIDGLVAGFDCFLAVLKPDMMSATGYFLIGLGSLWGFVPKEVLGPTRHKIKSMLARSRLTAGLEAVFEAIEAVGALPELGKMIGGPLLQKDGWKKFDDGAKGMIKKLMSNPAAAAQAAPALAAYLLRHLPEHVVEKLMFRMAGKKVPLAGTIAIGLLDIVDIVRDPTDGKNWVSLGSTVAGALPGAGTAVSVVADLGVLALTVADSLRSTVGKSGKTFEVHMDLLELRRSWGM